MEESLGTVEPFMAERDGNRPTARQCVKIKRQQPDYSLNFQLKKDPLTGPSANGQPMQL